MDFSLQFMFSTMLSIRIPQLLRQMSLVYMVSKFEGYLQNVMTIAIEREPRVLKTRSKNLTYEEVLDHKDVKSLVASIAKKDLDSLSWGGIDEINTYLKCIFGFDMGKLDDWNQLKERFYRRNVVIHNNGLPNEMYRRKTGYTGAEDGLSTGHDYLSESDKLFGKYAEAIAVHLNKKFMSCGPG